MASTVSKAFEELARQPTPMGDITLRRRLEPTLLVDVWEVKLGDDFLMSSLFTTGERELSHLGLAAAAAGELDVVIGGLGLGYTALAALENPRVRSVRVIDALAEVIDWHHRHLVPLGAALVDDDRCELVHGDFFAMVVDGLRVGDAEPSLVDVVLLDIDHSPRNLLDADHAAFYERPGLRQLAACLHPGGVFALWSDDPPDDEFVAALHDEFAIADAHVVTFPNFYTGADASSTVYVAVTPPLV